MTKIPVNFWKLIRLTFQEFVENNSFRLSSSLSYYTVFLIVPVLIIIVSGVGIVFGEDAAHGKIYDQLNEMVGDELALQIQTIIKHIEASQNSRSSVFVGMLILVVGASGVFIEIQDSINYLWSVKVKPKRKWAEIIIDRLLSFFLIASFGFLLLAFLLVSTIIDIMDDKLKMIFADATVSIVYSVNTFLILVASACMFAIIFKVLPDATVRWKDAFIGGTVSSGLFTIGKLLISFYIKYSDIGAIYGTAAAIFIMLLWVYYTSIILFLGASFTKNYAVLYGGRIMPKNDSVSK